MRNIENHSYEGVLIAGENVPVTYEDRTVEATRILLDSKNSARIPVKVFLGKVPLSYNGKRVRLETSLDQNESDPTQGTLSHYLSTTDGDLLFGSIACDPTYLAVDPKRNDADFSKIFVGSYEELTRARATLF